MTIRALIVDDHAYFRDSLRTLLTQCADVEVVAEAADGVEAVACAAAHQPDIVVMDINMPNLDGVAACARIKTASAHTPVVLYSASDIRELVRRATTSADALLGKQDLFTALPVLLEKIARSLGRDSGSMLTEQPPERLS